jgi:vacuolar-type H+-ATPase subunit H
MEGVAMSDREGGSSRPAEQGSESARRQGSAVADEAKQAAGGVAGTAREQAREVGSEAQTQARQVGRQVREKVSAETESQAHRLAGNLRQWADELATMADSGKPEAAPREFVSQVANAGRSAADYLDEHGVGGVMQEVQGFARRRPGAFLVGAALAGFAAGRVAKATRESHGQTSQAAAQQPTAAEPRSEERYMGTQYSAGQTTSERGEFGLGTEYETGQTSPSHGSAPGQSPSHRR